MKKVSNQISLAPDKVRALIKASEDPANSMMEAAQTMILIQIDILKHQFGFTEKDIKKFMDEMKHMLDVGKVAQSMGMSSMNSSIVRTLGEIVEMKRQQKSAKDSGLILPKPSKSEVLTKLLGK